MVYDPAAMVIDHISYAVLDFEGDHTLIACFTNSKAPVLFEGVAHTVLKVLSASQAACSANPKSAMSSPPELTGSAISLVSVVHVQPFIGLAPFSDSFDLWGAEGRELNQAVDVRHHKVGEAAEPAIYRIKDELVVAWDLVKL
ncbi:hypothetical protein NC651_022688 [Populus alba x Populus x berolinensis]|nr:hypothetical protein NC651_022688 [Populus alba x Populus x berolinensis]